MFSCPAGWGVWGGGQTEEGLSALAEGLAQVAKTGERYWEAELYRLKGELLSMQDGKNQKSKGKNQKLLIFDPQAEAEACFLKAIEVARKQQAKSLELRATVNLVRLRREQAKQEAPRTTQGEARYGLTEAHQMLSEIYKWFTE